MLSTKAMAAAELQAACGLLQDCCGAVRRDLPADFVSTAVESDIQAVLARRAAGVAA